MAKSRKSISIKDAQSPKRRRKPSSNSETDVLTKSMRRCALCFGLDGDLNEKAGQIAHLDHNPANSVESNLVFLCLEHHAEYDSKTSQKKNYTPKEVETYRNRLYRAIETGLLSTNLSEAAQKEGEKQLIAIAKHDTDLFSRSDSIMTETQLLDFLKFLVNCDSYTRTGLKPIIEYLAFFDRVENCYMSPRIKAALTKFHRTLAELNHFVAYNFFQHPKHLDNPPYCLYPDLCKDGRFENLKKYSEYQKDLHSLCQETYKAFEEYRMTIKEELLI